MSNWTTDLLWWSHYVGADINLISIINLLLKGKQKPT